MFAIDHAATALLVKRRFPSAPMTPLLLSVQAMELAWVALSYLGIERTATESTVRSVADIHLAYMPYSHSVGTALIAALAAWLIIEKGFRRAVLGRAVGLGIMSHLILDPLTHGHDIVLWPGLPSPKLGLGLYETALKLACYHDVKTQSVKRAKYCGCDLGLGPPLELRLLISGKAGAGFGKSLRCLHF